MAMVAKPQNGIAPENPRYKAGGGLDFRSVKKLPCDWLLTGLVNDKSLNGSRAVKRTEAVLD